MTARRRRRLAAPDPQPRNPPRGAFAIVVAVVLLTLAASSVPSPLYGLYQQRWQITPVTATVVYASYALGVVVILLARRTIARQRPRPLLLAALTTVALSSAVLATAHAVWVLDAARVLQGFGTGMVSAAATSTLTALHPTRDAGRASVASSAATAGGIGIGAAVSGLLVQVAPAPLATPYVVFGVAALVVAAALLTVPASAMEHRPAPGTTEQVADDPAGDRALSAPARRALWAVAPLVVASWAVTGIYLALGVELTGRLLQTDDHAVASLIIVVVQGIGGLVQVGCRGWSSLRAGWVGCVTLVAGVGGSVAAVGAGLPALFFAAAAVVGAGFGLCFLAGLRIVSQASGRDERSRAVSTFFLLGYLALSLPAIAAGLLRTRWGLDATFMAFGVTVMIGCAAAAWLVVRHHRRELAAVPTDPTAPEVTTDAGDRASGRR
jgi:MFS family permease